jgi:hypothetical protein
MADRNATSPWDPSHIRLTSETELDRLCSNDEPDGMHVKREEQTRLRAHRNPGALAPSRIRLTSEAEFDRLCSNDKPDAMPVKRQTQTRLRATTQVENMVDSKELRYITFILAVTLAHAILFAFFYL